MKKRLAVILVIMLVLALVFTVVSCNSPDNNSNNVGNNNSNNENVEDDDNQTNDTQCDCVDTNNNHKCDICGTTLTKCVNDNNDHYCDICYERLTECEDEDDDHNCDICNKKLTSCIDSDIDDVCDICGEALEYSSDLKYSLKADDTYEVTAYEGEPTMVKIPSTFDNKPVTSINQNAFLDCSTLESVIIPKSITDVSAIPFFQCANLKSIDVDKDNENYKSIDGDLYSKDGKTLLRHTLNANDMSFTIPNSVINIGFGAFAFSALKDVTISDNVENIGDFAFYYALNLNNLTLGSGLKTIGSDVFGCPFLTNVNYTGTINQWVQIEFGNENANPFAHIRKLYIGGQLITEANINTATSINDYALIGLNSLKKVTIGESVEKVGVNAFVGCMNLETNVKDGVKYLGNESNPYLVAVDCDKTLPANVVIDENCIVIESSAFSNNSSLESIVIGNKVTDIGDNVFSYCTALKSVVLGENVVNIGKNAFIRCTSLDNVVITGKVTRINSYRSEEHTSELQSR